MQELGRETERHVNRLPWRLAVIPGRVIDLASGCTRSAGWAAGLVEMSESRWFPNAPQHDTWGCIPERGDIKG